MLWRARRDRQGLRRGRAQGADRRVVLCRREPRPRRSARWPRAQLSVRFVLGFGPTCPTASPRSMRRCTGQHGPRAVEALPAADPPAMITFTARAGAPLRAGRRAARKSLLAQGAMTVLALVLDTGDVILNPYPLTGPVGLSLGLMPWLVGGATLVQHHPVRLRRFRRAAARQRRDGDGAAGRRSSPSSPRTACCASPQCRLRRLGAVWSMPELPRPRRRPSTARRRCCSISIRSAISPASCCGARRARPDLAARSAASHFEDDEDAVFVETKLGRARLAAMPTSCCCADRWSRARTGTACARRRGFVSTGLRAKAEAADSDRLRIKRDPELLHHGGFAIAATELDELYQSFPGYLDAACFVLSGSGHRRPHLRGRSCRSRASRSRSRRCTGFSIERQVAPYKFPDTTARGEADPARRRRPRAARADLAAGVVATPPASPRRRS